MQYEVAFLQEGAYSGNKNGKRVNAAGEEQCHHCSKKDGNLIDEWHDLSPDKMYHINKNRAKRWSNKNGNNHNQVGEVVNVMDADLEMEAGLSILVPGKNAFGDNRSQTSLPNKKYKANYLTKNQICLDNCSTYISFFNKELLEDIC